MSADGTSVRMLLLYGSAVDFPDCRCLPTWNSLPCKSLLAPTPDSAAVPASIDVSAGRVLAVLLTQVIDVDVAQAGMIFRALSMNRDARRKGGHLLHSAVLLQATKVEQAGNLEGADRNFHSKPTLQRSAGGDTMSSTSQVEQKAVA